MKVENWFNKPYQKLRINHQNQSSVLVNTHSLLLGYICFPLGGKNKNIKNKKSERKKTV